ncbi:MAG: MATE family efflux transporter, partial [Chlamydiales bacterium]
MQETEQRGDFRNLWILFLPLVGTTFCNYLFQLLEKLFLARVSKEAMEAALNATYACQIFQMATLALVMMAQVSVARWYSAKQWSVIGPGVWQFIWFSLLSMLLTVPCSLLYGNWYFRGMEIETAALSYFYIFTAFSFLYPLGASLSCFFLGMGKIRLVLLATLADQGIKILLCYLFIFGINPWIPPQGLLGGVMSNLVAQALLCLVFGVIFLQKKNRDIYHSHHWKFRIPLFWSSIKPGLFRALNRLFSFGSWLMIARLMNAKGGDHLLFISLGGTLTLFIPFLFEAIYQSQTIVVSQLLGANKIASLFKAARSGLILVGAIIILVSFPFLGFSSFTFERLFPDIFLDPASIRMVFFGVWLWFAYFTLAAIPLSYIFAFKDTQFYSYLGIVFCVTDYFLMQFFVNQVGIAPKFFWITLSLVQMTNTIPIYFWRMNVLCKRALKNRNRDQLTIPIH